MASTGVRIGVLGATGALGVEVLAALDASSLRVASLRPAASDRSLGHDIEFQGEIHPVETEPSSLRGLDLVFCCAPPQASLAWVREALRSEVPCIDLSGALLGSDDVPLLVAPVSPDALRETPVVSAATGASLCWSLVLGPLHAAVGVRRVHGVVLDAASVGGRDAIETLSRDSLALFEARGLEPEEGAPPPIAFDCLPPPGDGGEAEREAHIRRGLCRLLDAELAVSVTAVQVPAFVGQASALAIETGRPLDAKQARDLLTGAARVELWPPGDAGPNLRAGVGRDVALVGRVRSDPATEGGLLLWIVTDPLRLTAANAVDLAVARLVAR